MAITNVIMQQKRGPLSQLDKSKLLPGQFAIPIDSNSIFICIRAGIVLEIPTKESLYSLIESMDSVIDKGTSIIEDFERLEVEKVSINDSNTSLLTTYSSSKILELIDAINEFNISIVHVLPAENIDNHTIYFVSKTTSGGNDVYDEYIFIDNKWEHIGSTAIDLSDYYNKSQVDSKIEQIENTLAEKTSLLLIENVEIAYELGPGTSSTFTKSVLKEGYKAIGVVGYRANLSFVIFSGVRVNISSQNAEIQLRNTSTGTASTSTQLRVLYIKEE